ncbi:ankyrin repeat-containing domain protein [Lasiosphaeria miniovina]|uniref:Ankyrin repeat-containing domain protein n=1 Tax=Lasiosphaeria miniovina TaxID=1954250 RepID=A0AA40ALA8_9PEZI|nr:ankyrin repeat-containing domain protein [Lasiosphaeria miniovina]KAK0717932.1 ankyrin repeat-containing domain protein [Lasiosphaeria miniovina]
MKEMMASHTMVKLRKLTPKAKTKKADTRASSPKPPPKPTPHPIPVLRLPPEIVLLILELLDPKDQLALDRTSRFFYFIVNPTIYTTNVRLERATCVFWGAENGQLGTLKHALAAGADLNASGPIDRKAAAESATTNANGDGGTNGDATENADDDEASSDSRIQPWGTALHLAAKGGHREVVEWLLDNGADMNAPSFRLCECQSLKGARHPSRRLTEWPRWRALHTAMCFQERLVAELLIFRGANLDLDVTAGHNHTALHSAAANGLIPVIKLLALDPNFVIEERDATENTALHYVAELWGARDCAEIRDTVTKLLALGADLEAHNESGHTPLLNACYRGNYAAALRLISVGANPDPHRHIPNFRDIRPLFYCTIPRSEFFDLDEAPVKHDEFEGNRVSLIKALVDAGAEVDALFDKRGYRNVTALMLACELAEPRAVTALIKGGAAVNAQDRVGRTPLFFACSVRVDHRAEVPEISSVLLRHGARLDLEEDPNNSPLEWAIKHVRWGDSDILEVMLNASDEVNLTESKLKNALKKCASSGNYKAMRSLLKFGDRTYGISDDDIKEYLDLTIQQNDPWNQRDTFSCLMDFGKVMDSNEVLLFKTLLQKNRDLTMAVLERGVVVSDPRFYGGQTYLHMACQWGDIDVVKALLERAAEVNVFDRELRTPLSIAVSENNKVVASQLIREVADPHLVPSDDLLKELFDEDDDEWRIVKRRYHTAFDIAIASQDRASILEEMLSHYELPQIRPGSKFTYVHRACQNPNTEVLSMLLRKGACPKGGEGCPNPPLGSLLRHLWEEPKKHSLASCTLRTAKVLLSHCVRLKIPIGATAYEMFKEIGLYDGPDTDRQILRGIIQKELGVRTCVTDEEVLLEFDVDET